MAQSCNHPKRRFRSCEYVLSLVPARKPETVADILADQRAPKELRGKRYAFVCAFCGQEEVIR